MTRLRLDLNIADQRLLARNRERASANREALQERKTTAVAAQAQQSAAAAAAPAEAERRGGNVRLDNERRPAATRRKQDTLTPVWVVTDTTQYNSYTYSDSLTRTVSIYTGTQGLIAQYQPWGIASPPTVSTDDGGLLATLLTAYSDPSNYRIDGSEWTGTLQRQCYIVSLEVIDGVAYITLLRGVFTQGKARVGWTLLGINGAPTSSSDVEESAQVATHTSYDFLYTTVDLKTGVLTHTSAPFYQSNLSVTGRGGFYGASRNYQWSVGVTYSDYRQVLAGLLRSSHPFYGCSASALYGHLNTPASPSAFNSNGYDMLPYWWQFGSSNYPRSIHAPIVFLSLMGGGRFISLSAKTNQHVVRYYDNGVDIRELATFSDVDTSTPPVPLYRQCSNYRYLGAIGPTSFSTYTSTAVKSADKYLKVNGLSEGDRALVKAGVSFALPATVNPTRRSTLNTTKPTLFTTYSGTLSFETSEQSYLLFAI